MSLEKLEKLLDLFHQKNLSELEYQEDGFRVKLKRWPTQPTSSTPAIEATEPKDSYPKVEPAIPVQDKKFATIEAPMVGTFYRAPSPESPPYVEEGQEVKKGQVICVIEAMKLMNEIESDIEGRILSVMAQNAQPVEFGQLLFTVEPVLHV